MQPYPQQPTQPQQQNLYAQVWKLGAFYLMLAALGGALLCDARGRRFLLLALVAAGVAVPGAPLARALADRILCAASLADGCGDEPELIAAYGSEVGELVRRQMPMLAFEHGSRAVPVDFRNCRVSACGDATGEGQVSSTDEHLPVTAFVHVVDCREEEAERIYALLVEGGEIFMKMEQTGFANRFAMLRDRFGTSWMLLHQPESA